MFILGDLMYGFDAEHLFVRLDPIEHALEKLKKCEIRVAVWDAQELRLVLKLEGEKLVGTILERAGATVNADGNLAAASGRIIEIALSKSLFNLHERNSILLGVGFGRMGCRWMCYRRRDI
jgi:hypothetical protein